MYNSLNNNNKFNNLKNSIQVHRKLNNLIHKGELLFNQEFKMIFKISHQIKVRKIPKEMCKHLKIKLKTNSLKLNHPRKILLTC